MKNVSIYITFNYQQNIHTHTYVSRYTFTSTCNVCAKDIKFGLKNRAVKVVTFLRRHGVVCLACMVDADT